MAYNEEPNLLTVHPKEVRIGEDGSNSAFDPATAAGMEQILESGPEGFVKSSDKDNSVVIKFRNGDKERLAVNPDTHTLVSQTALDLNDAPIKPQPNLPRNDPDRYINADKVPYIALTKNQAHELHVELGDRVHLEDPKTGKDVWAVYGDIAGHSHGEGNNYLELSGAAAQKLGVSFDDEGHTLSNIRNLKITGYPHSGYGAEFPHGDIAAVDGHQESPTLNNKTQEIANTDSTIATHKPHQDVAEAPPSLPHAEHHAHHQNTEVAEISNHRSSNHHHQAEAQEIAHQKVRELGVEKLVAEHFSNNEGYNSKRPVEAERQSALPRVAKGSLLARD